MELFMYWLSFIGSWLLFAGPIYQAALELQDEDIEIDRIRAVGSQIEKPVNTSVWWWFLPPVKMYLERKRKHEYQIRYLKALSAEDVESLVSYRTKATAWLFVAVGGLCIACDQTYTLAEYENWSDLVLVILIIIMLLASIFNLITRIKRARKLTSL
jgi:hypothetical protein